MKFMLSKTNKKTKTLSQLSSTSSNINSIIYITVDSEWYSILNQWLCTQVLVRKSGIPYLYFFAWEGLPQKEIMRDWCNSNYTNFVEVPSYDQCLPYLMESLHLSGDAHLRFFYSPKDITYFIGEEAAREVFLHNLEKKRVISGKFKICTENYSLTLHCKDAVGWSNKGLADLAAAVGVEMVNKSSMDEYKNNMIRGAEENPLEFIQYAIDDVVKLDEIFEKYLELIQWVEVEVLGIPGEKTFKIDNLPMTQGSIVAKSFEKWMINRSSNPDMLNFAIRKLGVLKVNQSPKKQAEDLKAYSWAAKSWTIEKLKQEKNNPLLKYFLENTSFEQVAYSGANIPILAKHSYKDSTLCFNAIVQGGRCNNEIPTEYFLDYALDIDLQACYGSTLRNLSYPIGLPKAWSYSPNENKPKLGEFIKKNLNKFEDRLWQIIVNGELPFKQDLIFSKDVKGVDINKSVSNGFDENRGDVEGEDISHIPGTFCLLRKEIVNGIITSDILEVILKVSSSKELGHWYNLEVTSAMAWLKKDKCLNEEEFINKVLKDSKIGLTGVKEEIAASQSTHDRRSAYWYSIPLEDFIGKLVDKRMELKKLGENSKQNILKLFINTLYGDFASPFFSIGNVILANNITARARIGAWMMSKALILKQTITDGGLYTPTRVAYFEGRKPSFEKLSDPITWVDTTEYRYIKPLGEINWQDKFKEFKSMEPKKIQNYVDNLASRHIEKFWEPYGLSLNKFFNIEHKVEHTAMRAAYICKGHYALKSIFTEENLYRVRGSKRYSEEDIRENPIFEILDSILKGRNIPNIPTFEYDHKHLLSLSHWKLAQQSSEGYEQYKQLMPGDEAVDKRIFRLNNNYFPTDTLKEYLSRQNRKKVIRNNPTQWFERYILPNGLECTTSKMELNDL